MLLSFSLIPSIHDNQRNKTFETTTLHTHCQNFIFSFERMSYDFHDRFLRLKNIYKNKVFTKIKILTSWKKGTYFAHEICLKKNYLYNIFKMRRYSILTRNPKPVQILTFKTYQAPPHELT